MVENKSQSSIEFVLIISILFLLLVPSLFVFNQFGIYGNRLLSESINDFGYDLLNSLEMINSTNKSETFLQLDYSSEIKKIAINPSINGSLSEFIITANVFGSNSNFVFFTNFSLAPEGNYNYSSILTTQSTSITNFLNQRKAGFIIKHLNNSLYDFQIIRKY